MIDWLTVEAGFLDDADTIGVSIGGETAVGGRSGIWAVLAGGGYGTISPCCGGDNINHWHVNLGLKCYVFPLTGLSAMGSYGQYLEDDDCDVKAAIFTLKQRLVSAKRPVSPFLEGTVVIRERSRFSDTVCGDRFSERVEKIGAGCDLSVNEELSFVFEGAYVNTEQDESSRENLDGWMGAFSMKYYFY